MADSAEIPPVVAVYQYDGYMGVMLHPPTGEDYEYILYEDDPYGWAPALRVEVQRLIDEGELVVTDAAPADPNKDIQQ